MKPTHDSTYDIRRANSLLPLLRSIGREIEERTAMIERLEQEIERLQPQNRPTQKGRALIADVATQRRELRHAREELQRFGCSVLGTAPLTIRIPGRGGEAKKSFVWQTGDPVLK